MILINAHHIIASISEVVVHYDYPRAS